MTKAIFIFLTLSSFIFFGCNKCQECYVVEYESNGTTIKKETSMGEYCDSDAKQQAEEKAIADGITCSICHVECR